MMSLQPTRRFPDALKSPLPEKAALSPQPCSYRAAPPRPPIAEEVGSYSLIALGAFVVALSFTLFQNGNGIVSGGASGISTLLQQSRFHFEPSLTLAALNLPLFLIGTALLGRRFGAKTLLGMALMPAFVYLTRHLHPVTDNTLLAALYGGLGTGIGTGFLIKGGGSTGGTTVIAQILTHRTQGGISPSAGQTLLDGTVIAAAGLVLGPERAMYGLIGLLVTKRAIDLVLSGVSTSKLALVICRDREGVDSVRRGVLEQMNRGITVLSGSGGFTGEDRSVLMVVVGQSEVARLKALVHTVDSRAFMIVTEAAEVLGEGFRTYRI